MSSPVIIDTHAHLFQPERDAKDLKAEYEIFEFGEKRDVHLSTMTGTLEEMLPAMAAAGIEPSIVLNLFIANWERDRYKRRLPGGMSAAECDRRLSRFESELPEGLKGFNRWGCEVAGRHPQLLAYACTDIALLGPEESADHIRDMIENAGAAGLKLHGSAHNFAMSDGRLWPTLSVCREFDAPVIAHSGSDRRSAGLADPRAFAAMLQEFPELTIVLAHLGGGSWRQTLEIAETFANVYFYCVRSLNGRAAPMHLTTMS